MAKSQPIPRIRNSRLEDIKVFLSRVKAVRNKKKKPMNQTKKPIQKGRKEEKGYNFCYPKVGRMIT